MNISTSHDGPFANTPASYAVIANAIEPDQITLYFERQPDTVQTDHFDWGFRLPIYGAKIIASRRPRASSASNCSRFKSTASRVRSTDTTP